MTYLSKKWRVTIFYTTTPVGLTIASHEHNFYVNLTGGVAPGGLFDEFTLTQRNSATIGLDAYIDAYMDYIYPLFFSTSQFIRAELWAADVASDNFVFYSTLALGLPGTSLTATRPYVGQIITYRNSDGKSMRTQLMETTLTEGPKDPYPFASAASASLAAHLIGSLGCIVNKFFAFPIAPINNCVEQNEKLWDDRNGR